MLGFICTKKEKTNLYQVFEICSPEELPSEISQIKNILLQNGYPEKVIIFKIKNKLKIFNHSSNSDAEKCQL